MTFSWKKTENCFSDAQTYEYEIPITAEAFMERLDGWTLRCNRKLRRPVLIAEKPPVRLKAVLSANLLRVSFPEGDWEREKAEFERWLAYV